ncbi:MAG TPA: hemolysin family protein [Gemmatimonadales bacterium]|nr:hemolysin family protein [Gemmatimonadales bacterium]
MIWIVLGVGLILSVFGAAAGAALVSVGRLELTRAASRRLRGGPSGPAWLSHIDQYLAAGSATMSLGVIVLGACFPVFFTGFQFLIVATLAILIAVPLVLFGGYLLPRWLAQPRAEAIVRAVVPVLRPWVSIVSPLLPSRGRSRPANVGSVLREGAAAGLENDQEMLMVAGVMTFTERPVREIMTPRTEIVAIAEDTPVPDIRMTFAHSGYTRIPVYRGTLDDITGILHAFDLFKVTPGDPLPVRPVTLAPASRHCGDLLLDMQRERRHLAIILDEFGGTLGLATFEDLLEELVGEIFDEHDEESKVGAPPTSGVFETDGATAPMAIETRFAVDLGTRAATIGGLLIELTGRIPLAGERFTLKGLEIDVVQASPNRVERVLIRPGPVSSIALK